MKYSYSETEIERYRKVEERYSKWMKDHWYSGAKAKFEWNEENVCRILTLNDAIIEKENNLYRLLSNVKADIENLLASGKANYNWNVMFRDIPDKRHLISRSLHRLMQEETYTLEDLLWLNPDNFEECIEIRN